MERHNGQDSLRAAHASEAMSGIPMGAVAEVNRKLNAFIDSRGLLRGQRWQGKTPKEQGTAIAPKSPKPAPAAGKGLTLREREAIGERIKLAITTARLTLGYLAITEDASPEKIERVMRGETGVDALRARLCERFGITDGDAATPVDAPVPETLPESVPTPEPEPVAPPVRKSAPAVTKTLAKPRTRVEIGTRIREVLESRGIEPQTAAREIGERYVANVHAALNGFDDREELRVRLCEFLWLDNGGFPRQTPAPVAPAAPVNEPPPVIAPAAPVEVAAVEPPPDAPLPVPARMPLDLAQVARLTIALGAAILGVEAAKAALNRKLNALEIARSEAEAVGVTIHAGGQPV